jgi:hypothetical protein
MALRPDYCTSAELKSYRRIEAADTEDDSELGLAITAASRAVDRFCGRPFGSAAQDRFYTARWDTGLGRWVVDTDDIASTTGLSITYDSLRDGTYADAITVYTLAPANAVADDKPWTRIVVGATDPLGVGAVPDGVQVSATFGWASVPTTVKTATLVQASRFLMRRDSPFGMAGEGDFQIRLLDRVDPDVAAMLRTYRKLWGAA